MSLRYVVLKSFTEGGREYQFGDTPPKFAAGLREKLVRTRYLEIVEDDDPEPRKNKSK